MPPKVDDDIVRESGMLRRASSEEEPVEEKIRDRPGYGKARRRHKVLGFSTRYISGSWMVLNFLKKLKKKEKKEEQSKTGSSKPTITQEFKIIEVDNKQYAVRDVKSITPDEIVVKDLDGSVHSTSHKRLHWKGLN